MLSPEFQASGTDEDAADSASSPNAAGTPSVPMLAIETLLDLPSLPIIDLRTPAEFAEDHLPGAVNVPLFSDAQRHIVGTLYKQSSPAKAFEQGREFGRERVDELVSTIAEIAGVALPSDGVDSSDVASSFWDWSSSGLNKLVGQVSGELCAPPKDLKGAAVLHCWRGGLRSRAVIYFLRQLGLQSVYGLDGGYRSYRRQVVADLEAPDLPRAFCLRGGTGVGKTLVLRAIERLRPGWTIDLEDAARHRSSLLGMVGLEPVSQKAFDSYLAKSVRAGFGPCVIYEGESRKVGDAIIPKSLWDSLCAAENILLEASTEYRVKVLAEDYLADPAALPKLREQLTHIERFMGSKKYAGVLSGMLDRGLEEGAPEGSEVSPSIAELVSLLLERYYDPLYGHSEKDRGYALRLPVSDAEQAARDVVAWVEERLGD